MRPLRDRRVTRRQARAAASELVIAAPGATLRPARRVAERAVHGARVCCRDRVCELIAQEAAHSFGLDHEFLCRDPMTYLEGCGPVVRSARGEHDLLGLQTNEREALRLDTHACWIACEMPAGSLSGGLPTGCDCGAAP